MKKDNLLSKQPTCTIILYLHIFFSYILNRSPAPCTIILNLHNINYILICSYILNRSAASLMKFKIIYVANMGRTIHYKVR